MAEAVPAIRIRRANAGQVRAGGEYVLYWMTAYRRTGWNFSLQRAVEHARELGRPLLVFEALRAGYPWASDRLHAFVIEGMAENARRLARKPVTYYPYLEPEPGADNGLLEALAARACVVVTDLFPAFFLPRMLASAAKKVPVLLEVVDSNGLLPLDATDKLFTTAFAFRAHVQRTVPQHLAMPRADPLVRAALPEPVRVPRAVLQRWPAATPEQLARPAATAASLPIDHTVAPSDVVRGGPHAAERQLHTFLTARLARYGEERNVPDLDATSGLSPYLHFGMISAHQVFADLMEREGWSPTNLALRSGAGRRGWWGVSANAEEFLDELITWRELGYNTSDRMDGYDRFESLPDWAISTLQAHARDARKFRYTLDEFARGETHDPLWNAAQVQLVREGRIHNYLRMLWGKKIVEWTAGPREALAVMVELNNRYALDGRDPNSYSGIFWVLGRYDRPWGPERPIFGKVRYMSSENTARKVEVERYLERYRA